MGTPLHFPEDVVHSAPERLGGTPVFVGTRVPVQSLFDYLEAGDSLEEFLHQFPSVRREQAIAAFQEQAGWRAYGTNRSKSRLTLQQAVEQYAGQWQVERDRGDPVATTVIQSVARKNEFPRSAQAPARKSVPSDRQERLKLRRVDANHRA